MLQSSKVLWGEGLFLRPQHFQQQDAFHEKRLAEATRNLHPYSWGVKALQVDEDALSNGVFRLNSLALIFEDGEMYTAPGEDVLPNPITLQTLERSSGEITFYACIAPLRANASNFQTAEGAVDGGVRYVQKSTSTPDNYTKAADFDLATLRRYVTILPEDSPRDHLLSVPICRVKRSSKSAFAVDETFVAPSISIGCAPFLMASLQRQLDALQAKVNALYGYHREPSKHVIEFRSGDIASFWLLHTASTAYAGLMHFAQHPSLHPERLFQRFAELAGGLMTFSQSSSLADIPAYKHEAPTQCFHTIQKILDGLLETVISTKYFAIALEQVKPSFFRGRLESETITPQTGLFLSVKAAMAPLEIIELVPQRFKVGAPDDVDKLVLSAMSGVRLVHAAQVPAAIPVKPGYYYFTLDAKGSLYERMLQAQNLTIYAPSGIADLEMELFALNL
jgi:type VI secretion system protein ImpJ